MKTLNFSGSFVTCDLKVGRYRQHVELMKCCELKGQGHFLTLAKGHLQIKGARWRSGRASDSESRGPGFDPHKRHRVVSLSKTH